MLTPDDIDPVLRRITGRTPAAWSPRDAGAYSPSGRWVVTWAEGGSAFVKAEESPDAEHGVGIERLVYALALPCLPRLYAFDAGPPAVIVTEDLSHARWGAPVTEADTAALCAALDSLAGVRAPEGVPRAPVVGLWRSVAEVVGIGLADEAWAAAHLPALAEAADAADVTGDALVHADVWLQNWCRTDRGVVIVDWSGSYAANHLLMRAGGEAAVRAAGGPPGRVLSGRPEWAAWAAGMAAFHLGRTDPASHPLLLETERREALATLRWACEELGLPEPAATGPYAALGPWRP